MKKSQSSTDAGARTIWTLLGMAFLLAPSLVWIVRDRTVWPWDQAWYGQVSTELWYWLWRSPLRWGATMADGIDLKPPGIVWFGQFFIGLRGVLGSVEASLLLSILVTQLALLWILFRTCASLFPGSRLLPAAGVMFAAAGQLFTGLSHQYFVEPLQAVAVAWSLYAAQRSRDWPKARVLIHVFAILILAALSKATTVIYCFFPLGYAALQTLRRTGRFEFGAELKGRFSRGLLIGFGALAMLCGVWYLRHISDVLRHVHNATTGEVALEYGSRAAVWTKLGVWAGLLKSAFLAPYLTWVLASAFCLGPIRSIFRRTPIDKQVVRAGPIAIVCVLQTICLLLAFSSTIGVDSRYMFAVLPCLAILFVQCCALAPRIATMALLAACFVQWASVQAASFSPAYTFADRSEWLRAFQPDRARYDDIARVVAATTGGPEHNNIVAVDESWLNSNTLEFFAAQGRLKTGARSYYVSLGYAQKDPNAAFNRIEEFSARYVVTLHESFQRAKPNFLNVTALPVLKRIQQDSHFTQLPFANGSGIVLFQVGSALGRPGAATPAADSTIVPAGIARGQIIERGKSALDSINGSAREKSGFFIFAAEGVLSCDGWAFDDQQNSTPDEVWIELTEITTGRRHFWRARRYSRAALAAALQLPSVANAGFQCEQAAYQLPRGAYSARIYQIDGHRAMVSDLNTYTEAPRISVR
jgi:hypothetical protein